MPRKELDIGRLNSRVVKSGKEFEAAVKEAIDAIGRDISHVCRASVFGLYEELVERCPKDTARAAAGFNIGETPSEWTPENGDYDGGSGQTPRAQVLENQRKLSQIPDHSTICISNNVEYLLALENGHSKQAPTGFIALALQSFASKLRQAAESANKRRHI